MVHGRLACDSDIVVQVIQASGFIHQQNVFLLEWLDLAILVLLVVQISVLCQSDLSSSSSFPVHLSGASYSRSPPRSRLQSGTRL